MPITNGNYTVPAWENGQAPAVNDTELLAMSQTLQQAQVLQGSGAPTQYTNGVVGQLYRDTSTTPNTIYQCVVSATEANQWQIAADPNINLALAYNPSSTYVKGDYCVYRGKLYRAKQNITISEEFTPSHWDAAYAAEDLSSHVGDTDNPHDVTKEQVGLGNVANERQYSAENPPKLVGSIEISATWTGDSSPYSQTVTVTGETVSYGSKIDLQPTAAQIADLISDGVTGMMVENNNGTLTVYALGAQTTSSMTVQCTAEETDAQSGTTVFGNPLLL